ncbi:hypothetical protein MES4922_90055 [Mesorhizobium ventifaucium]|uniref:Uncharacterized protein n=1 Tax=Mesorhizobium ventifaucium TaxID=666020 RepID=A0ABN8KH30_9HYPH|nr:hypothetical protein MES4922_90055 [Mesorhizobium ventifaucium]
MSPACCRFCARCCRFHREPMTVKPGFWVRALQQQLIRQTRAADKLDAIGGDSAVARIDAERRTVLLEIEEKAVRYIELKLGVMSAGNALRVYRERHRSGMMARASDAFALITRGQYSGLATQPVKGGEVLIALQRDGQSKVADAAVKGRAFSALPGPEASRLLRVCPVSTLRAIHCR